jgi:hypothetical protein
MKYRQSYPVVFAVIFLAAAALACYGGTPAVPTPMPPPPSTEVVRPTPAEVVPPTAAEVAPPTAEQLTMPTPAPDTGSQQSDEFNALLQKFKDKGYIKTTEGDTINLDPFKEESADPSHYQWWPYTNIVASDLLFKGHLKWSTASATSNLSGCGVIFGLQENKDHYGVFLDKSRIAFFMSRGKRIYEIGKTKGNGRLDFSNPAEADLVLAVKGKTSYISVNDEVTQYTLSQDQSTDGNFALTLWSGTGVGYGTRCEMTDMVVFIPK